MKVFVTGAGGFVGRAVVMAARAAGHSVMAMRRATSRNGAPDFPDDVMTVIGDLRQNGEWCAALQDADAIIHCAVAFGSLPDTVLATENLLAAAPRGLARFVHVSSIAVYDFAAPRWPASMDERSLLEKEPHRRDEYTQLKLRQEQLISDHCLKNAIPLVVARPVAVYGYKRNWNFARAGKVGCFDLIFAPFSKLRLIHVRDCASALVAALDAKMGERGSVEINLMADELCGNWSFYAKARRLGAKVGVGIPVPYSLVRLLGWSAVIFNKLIFSNRKKLLKQLDPVQQAVMWRPMAYSNNAAKCFLEWEPKVSLQEGIEELVRYQA